MADSLSVSGPIDVRADCKQRVAYDLMHTISRTEPKGEIVKDETYWLKLYIKCRRATEGYSLSSSQKVE
jgi:hypothetical protein